jgi:hypothetical protein
MKQLLLLSLFTFAFCKFSAAQVICIFCYDQNEPISPGINNLLLNGSFENNNCIPWPSSDSFCPNSSNYACDIADWTCAGGNATYSYIFDATSTVIPDGAKSAYFGNSFCKVCSQISNDTFCLANLSCSVTGIPSGYPMNDPAYGGPNGVSLQQTVTGLIPGNTYILEFWVGGEEFGFFQGEGVFAVDVGFGDTLLRCPATGPIDTGRIYIVEFNATSTSHPIKFTNWGHICDNCTELVLDNVRLYTLAELSPDVPFCAGSASPGSFAASDTTVCEKFCISFFDSSQNNPDSWLWQFPGGNPSTSTDQNPVNICYNNPGVYDVTLITTNGAATDTLTLASYITVFSTPLIPTITQSGYTLTSTAGSTYQWQFNSIDIPGATNQSYDVTQTGYYTVFITDENGCSSSATLYILITGVEDVFTNGNLLIYPNPSDGSFMVEWLNGLIVGDLSIDVVSTLGEVIFSSKEKNISCDWKKEIDLRRFNCCISPGVYFIEIRTQNDFVRKKIVITR